MSISNKAFETYMKENPHLLGIALTTVQGKRWSADRLIRRFGSIRHKVDIKDTFSHTGLVFSRGQRVDFCHQTFPVAKYERWEPRGFNRIYIIDTDKNNRFKARALHMYFARRRYGILQLLSKILTSITFGAIPAPIKKGQDCSEFVARATEEIWENWDINPDSTDPTELDIFLNYLLMTTDWVDKWEVRS